MFYIAEAFSPTLVGQTQIEVFDILVLAQLLGRIIHDNPARLHDVGAVGALVHRMILGKEPFESDNPLAIIDKVKTDDPAGLHGDSEGLSTGMRDFLEKALDKDPEKRFQDGTGMMGAF